jgi:RNA polymerase sigma-70 factor (ECF subfamily)
MNFSPADIRAIVRMVTRRTGAPVHDEDLEQEAALRAVEAFRRTPDIRHPRAFLTKVVSDTVRDHWRRRRSTEDLDAINESRFAESPRFEDDLDRRRRLDLLRRAVATLDAGKRSTLKMFYSEERSVGEIAALRGKSPSAVKMELLRARRALSGIVDALARKKPR